MITEDKWIELQIGLINNEIKIASGKHTNNALQSMLILNMWKTQLELRLTDIRKNKQTRGKKE